MCKQTYEISELFPITYNRNYQANLLQFSLILMIVKNKINNIIKSSLPTCLIPVDYLPVNQWSNGQCSAVERHKSIGFTGMIEYWSSKVEPCSDWIQVVIIDVKTVNTNLKKERQHKLVMVSLNLQISVTYKFMYVCM